MKWRILVLFLKLRMLDSLLDLSYSYALCLPSMNPRKLVDHIHSGPAELVLEIRLRFRRRTRSNPCDFNEFLQALRSSETIRDVECGSQQKASASFSSRRLGVSETFNIWRSAARPVLATLILFRQCRGCCKQRSFTLRTKC
jgi:hypothetical protein